MSATPAAVPSTVTVVDLTFEGGGRAWLVASEDGDGGEGRPRPGVLWLHWLGHRHNEDVMSSL